MIYELRTYTLAPGAQAEYLRVQREIGRRVRGDRFGTFEGGWTSEFGGLNRYVHLWSYADAGERQRLRVALSQEPAWAAEYLPAIRPLVVAQENKLLLPVDGIPFGRPEGGRHIYELRSYRTQFQRLPEWLGHFKAVLPMRREFSPLVGMWTTDVGALNQVVHLWAYASLDQRAEVRAAVAREPRWHEYLRQSVPLVVEMESIVLNPTEASPLR